MSACGAFNSCDAKIIKNEASGEAFLNKASRSSPNESDFSIERYSGSSHSVIHLLDALFLKHLGKLPSRQGIWGSIHKASGEDFGFARHLRYLGKHS